MISNREEGNYAKWKKKRNQNSDWDILSQQGPVDCKSKQFTVQESEDGLRKIKVKKYTPRANGITTEFLKHLWPTGKQFLLNIFNQS